MPRLLSFFFVFIFSICLFFSSYSYGYRQFNCFSHCSKKILAKLQQKVEYCSNCQSENPEQKQKISDRQTCFEQSEKKSCLFSEHLTGFFYIIPNHNNNFLLDYSFKNVDYFLVFSVDYFSKKLISHNPNQDLSLSLLLNRSIILRT